MEFGMPTLLEIDSLDETMKLCRTLELNFVELNMNLPQYQVEHLAQTDYLMELAQKYHCYYTIHLDENLNISDFNPLVAQAYIETVERTIVTAKCLHVPILNMHMNKGIHFTLPHRKVYLFSQYKEEYLESIVSFRQLCERAIGAENIHICIENTNGFPDYVREAIELLLQSEKFALTWDIGHSHTCGNKDEAFLMQKEERLKHFHIHDATADENHLELGTGEIDLLGRIATAERHRCRCLVETKTIKALKQSVQWLNHNEIRRKGA